MKKILTMAVLILLPLLQTACGGPTTQSEQQTLVDRATLATQEMMTQTVSDEPQRLLTRAKGVMICPRIFKAGFFFGGEGGNCVLLARAGNGTWSYPAFYTIGSGSFGFQFGVQDSQLIMLIMTERGLNAVLDSQIKLGANASIAVATIGAGIQGSTTAAIGADIIAFSAARGLFGGIALEGSVMAADTAATQAYYNQALAARQIVMQMQGANPGADSLRALLTRFGTPAPAPIAPPPGPPPGYAPVAPPPGSPPPGYAPAGGPSAGYAPGAPPPGYAPPYAPPGQSLPPPTPFPSNAPVNLGQPPGGNGPVQEQNLAPPPR